MFRISKVTEESRLIERTRPNYTPRTVPFAILVFLQLIGFPGLVLYCLQTFSCGKNTRTPHFNCENGSFVNHNTAMIVELSFTCSEVLSRAIFISFFLKLKGWKGMWKIFKQLCKISRMWLLAFICILCEVRLGSILYWVPDLSSTAQAIIALYILDAFAITIVAGTLSFIKILELVEDNIDITSKSRLIILFKCVIASFWAQYFVFLIIVTFQLAFDVSEVDPTFVHEDFKRALNLLRKSAQFVFMKQISGRLWEALFADENQERQRSLRETELVETGMLYLYWMIRRLTFSRVSMKK